MARRNIANEKGEKEMKIYKYFDGEARWLSTGTGIEPMAPAFPEFLEDKYEITDEEYKFLKRIKMID